MIVQISQKFSNPSPLSETEKNTIRNAVQDCAVSIWCASQLRIRRLDDLLRAQTDSMWKFAQEHQNEPSRTAVDNLVKLQNEANDLRFGLLETQRLSDLSFRVLEETRDSTLTFCVPFLWFLQDIPEIEENNQPQIITIFDQHLDVKESLFTSNKTMRRAMRLGLSPDGTLRMYGVLLRWFLMVEVGRHLDGFDGGSRAFFHGVLQDIDIRNGTDRETCRKLIDALNANEEEYLI